MSDLEDQLSVKLSTRQVAEAFGVKPVTVSSWVKQERLNGTMPRKARRLGRTFTIREVLLFAKCADDGGATEQQLREWWEKNEEKVLAEPTRDTSTDVLSSIE